jgi:hypothetical protein
MAVQLSAEPRGGVRKEARATPSIRCSPRALQAAVERLEGGKTFDPKTEAADNLSAEAVSRDSAKADVSKLFQDPTEQSFALSEDPAKESATSH